MTKSVRLLPTRGRFSIASSEGMPYPSPTWRLLSMSLVVTCAGVSGCGSTDTAPVAASAAYAGTYQVAKMITGSSCAPQPLPAPVSPDTSQYVQLPAVPSEIIEQLVAKPSGSELQVITLGSQGQALTDLTYEGTINADGTNSVARTLTPRTEGPRAGGHTFYVTEHGTASGQYSSGLLVLTPPGNGIAMLTQSTGLDVYIFREANANGQIFTTCTIADLTNGSRVSL
jgi:hypothetical protein